MSRRKFRKPKVLNHHIVYGYDGCTHKQLDIEVPIYDTEHYILTLLQRRGKYISKGFIRALGFFIWQHGEDAKELHLKQP